MELFKVNLLLISVMEYVSFCQTINYKTKNR